MVQSNRFVAITWIALASHRVGSGVMAQDSGDSSSSSSSSPSALYPDCSGDIELTGDAICDFSNNNADCGFDGGDCCECTCVDSGDNTCGEGGTGFFCSDPEAAQNCGPTPSPTASPTAGPTASLYPDCAGYLPHVGDGYCDELTNNADCEFDGGDCCACTCSDGPSHTCGQAGDGYDCKDPDVPSDCSTTPSPVAVPGYPECDGYAYSFQDGYCDSSLNNADCGYDGGDCCPCTCRDYSVYDDDYWYSDRCGALGYDCQDPGAPTVCEFESDAPTPSPASNTDYPDCRGTIAFISDGDCDYTNNNAECEYDGGDCCVCTCVDGSFYTCGPYNCLDPSAECTTTTTSRSGYDTYYTYWYGDDYGGGGGYLGDDDADGYRTILTLAPSPASTDPDAAGAETASVAGSPSSVSEGEIVGVFLLSVLAYCCLGAVVSGLMFCAAKRCMAAHPPAVHGPAPAAAPAGSAASQATL